MVMSVSAIGIARADDDVVRPQTSTEPASTAALGPPETHDCDYLTVYLEPSLAVAASSVGVAGMARIGLGVVARTCRGNDVQARIGGTAAFYEGELGNAPSFHSASGGEAEVDVPVGNDDMHVGLRVGHEVRQGDIYMAGLRWRHRGLVLGADVFTGMYTGGRNFGDPVDEKHSSSGAMVSAGYDVHMPTKVAIGIAVAAALLLGAALVVDDVCGHDGC